MAWYDRLLVRTPEVEEKLNPAQQYYDHQTAASRDTMLKIVFDMLPYVRYNSGIRKWI